MNTFSGIVGATLFGSLPTLINTALSMKVKFMNINNIT